MAPRVSAPEIAGALPAHHRSYRFARRNNQGRVHNEPGQVAGGLLGPGSLGGSELL